MKRRPRESVRHDCETQLPAGFEQRVAALPSGRPLPRTERAFFEPRFGRDLSGVRVHSGEAAGALARSLHAQAFTLGNDIVLGSRHSAGRELLAHELTHVVQQAGTGQTRVQRKVEEFPWNVSKMDALDPNRGFRAKDLAELDAKKIPLTFSGSLAPVPADLEKLLLENIVETVRFALDPNHPDRVIQLEFLEIRKKEREDQARKEGKPVPKIQIYDQPALRLDATDFYHGHVVVPKATYSTDPKKWEALRQGHAYSGFGPLAKQDPGSEIEKAIGGGEKMPTSRAEAAKVKAVADKHAAAYRKALSDVLTALKSEISAGVSYHTWEVVRPKIAGEKLEASNPVRNIFTPFNTNRPEFRLEGDQDFSTLINFSFTVERATGKITLFPGSEKQFVRAQEILQTP